MSDQTVLVAPPEHVVQALGNMKHAMQHLQESMKTKVDLSEADWQEFFATHPESVERLEQLNNDLVCITKHLHAALVNGSLVSVHHDDN